MAIESLIDVSAIIVSANRLGLPASEENIFDILIEKGILSKKLGEKLKDMKGFSFDGFKDAIESHLKKQKN